MEKNPLADSDASLNLAGAIGDAAVMFSTDVSRMLDYPLRSSGHRRARSETLGLQDGTSFDRERRVAGSGADGPSSDDTDEDVFSMYIDAEKLEEDFPTAAEALAMRPEDVAVAANERPVRIRHQRSLSAEGSSARRAKTVLARNRGATRVEMRKTFSPQQLEELALVDPNRARRIWANRQSAARSKERKMCYIQELVMRLQALQAEAAALTAQLSMLQRETEELMLENHELRMQLQALEQQVQMHDAINDNLRDEIQRLRFATGHLAQLLRNPIGGPMMNYGQQFLHPYPAIRAVIPVQQFQQLHIHQPQPLVPQNQVHQNNPEQLQEDMMASSPSPSPSPSSSSSSSSSPSSSASSTDLNMELTVNSADQNENSSENNASPME